jgi:hypothetical protein
MKKLKKFEELKHNLDVTIGVSGRYKLEISKDGKTPHTVLEFDNLVTNLGLDRLMSGNTFGSVIGVGSSSATPSASDVALGSFVARQATTTGPTAIAGGSPDYYSTVQYIAAFAQGAAAGNLTEVGIGDNNGSAIATLSRALILDGGGNPTTVTVLSDEYLTVTYQLRLKPSLTDVTGTLSGYTYTIRECYVGTSVLGSAGAVDPRQVMGSGTTNFTTGNQYVTSNTLTANTTAPAQTNNINASSATQGTYVNGTFTNTATITFTPASGALTINTAVFKFSGPKFQVGFSPAINKTTSHNVVLTLRLTVARYP